MSTPSRAKPSSVAEYVADLPPQVARVVGKIRGLVKKNIPGCKETISYGIPAFSVERVFMYCAAFKSHIGIYPPVRDDARLMKKLKPYANAKGNLRFPLSSPLPYPLITRLAKALAKSYAAKPGNKPGRRVRKSSRGLLTASRKSGR
jgi:uncharacterized protein YdhG (YjbR/CyaY superfamily)